jgi:PAS domain S-box-containing protein
VTAMTEKHSMTTPGAELRRVRSLIADLEAIVWEADARTMTHLFVSEGAADILGYSPREWVDDPSFWADHVHPEDRSRAVGEFVRAATDGDRFDMEYRFLAADDTVVWLRDLGHVVKDVDGNPSLVRGLMVEITAQKHGKAEQTEAETRYQSLVEQLPAIVYSEPYGLGSLDIMYISPRVDQILGIPPSRWMAEPGIWLESMYEEDRARVEAENRHADETGEPFESEYRMVAQDGRLVWFHDQAALIRDAAGEPLFWQGFMLDITARKEAEFRRAEAEARYRALVEQTPAIAYIDAIEGPVSTLYISPQTTEILGYTPEEWYEDPQLWSKIVHPDDATRDDYVDESGLPVSSEYRLIAKDGRAVWVHDQASLISDEDGKPKFWQGLLVDITAQKEAERLAGALEVERKTARRLRDVDQMKNTFLQAVSHDLRTPLAAILGLAITLSREDLDVDIDEARELAGRIAQNARKLDRIVNDLLDIDRLSRGIVEPTLRMADVGDLVRALVVESDLAGERRLTVTTEPVTIPVDAAKVERIVENLLANTGRHTPRTAQVWVRVQRRDDGALITVEDDGPGVPDELRDAIFEPFAQGDPSSHSPGVGVGLTLVARFTELHGGRAWVEPREGGGASFHVFLPAMPAAPLAGEIDQATKAGSSGPDASQA